MSTIASPRDSSISLTTRRPLPSTGTPVLSPTASARPSLDTPRSPPISSPNPGTTAAISNPSGTIKRKNRAALREYYNIQRGPSPAPASEADGEKDGAAVVEDGEKSEVPMGEMDAEGFDAEGYVKRVAEGEGLEELLRVYAKVVAEGRALDAEKKGLVYNNYNKLIAATETIRKMRTNMDPLNPMAAMLDPKLSQIHTQAEGIRASLPCAPRSDTPEARAQKRMREVANDVLDVPARLRYLMRQGRKEEAEAEWEVPRRLLVRWREKGVGGGDVGRLLEEGDGILRGEKEEEEAKKTKE